MIERAAQSAGHGIAVRERYGDAVAKKIAAGLDLCCQAARVDTAFQAVCIVRDQRAKRLAATPNVTTQVVEPVPSTAVMR